MSQMSSSGWLLAFIISLLLSLLMGLALVWLSIERTDKAAQERGGAARRPQNQT